MMPASSSRASWLRARHETIDGPQEESDQKAESGEPREISRSLLQSARESKRRKATSPYRSAMSMLTFYINRAGKRLPPQRRRILEQAKEELRKLRDREDTR